MELIRSESPALDRRVASTGLCLAADSGRLDLAEFFLECGAAVDGMEATANDGDADDDVAVINKGLKSTVPLHLACDRGHLDVVEFLLQCGASIDSRDDEGSSSLHYAAANGSTEVISYLVAKGADVNARTPEGWTPLLSACTHGRADSVRRLLQCGARLANPDFGDPVSHAAESGCLETVQAVLQHGSCVATLEESAWVRDPDVPVNHAAQDAARDALFVAAREGHLGMLRWLFEYVIDTKKMRPEDAEEFDLLHLACLIGDTKVLEFLLDKGYGAITREDALTAAQQGYADIVELLLNRESRRVWRLDDNNSGVSDDDDNIVFECPALVDAAYSGNIDVVRVLLDYGAAVDSRDVMQKTALHHACENNSLELVRLLLDADADIGAKCVDERTPVDLASGEMKHHVEACLRKRQTIKRGS
ncbi:ankyrin repeat-containing domain protein [Zopfochytrium polystomum]|nr:ankyrin repeat-containing domain protein [Zopfochytrium polystomum]